MRIGYEVINKQRGAFKYLPLVQGRSWITFLLFARKWCLTRTLKPGADPEIFEKGVPEAIIYKILERGGPKSLKGV